METTVKAKAENEVVNTCTSSAPPCLTAASILIPHTEKGGMVPLGTSVVTRCRHEAPDTSYTFHVVDRQADSYLWTTRVHRLLKKFNRVGLGVSAHAYYDSELHSTVTKFHDFLAMPFSGFYNIEGKTVCIEDQHKQGFIRWSFKSKEDYEFIARCAEIEEAKHRGPVVKSYIMYDFMIDGMGNMHWRRSGKEYASKTTADALIGYKEFVDRVNGDIALYTEHAEVLKMAGVSKSFNYLLHGPPGTGKTTMIKTLAAQHYAPIFVIKYFEIMNASCLNEMLNPSVPIDSAASGPIKFVVFEDFDRFMATARGKGFISQLLNSMDGLYDTPGVFRFFTGNGVEELLKEPALMNRISGVMMFHLPTQDMFVAQLVKLFSVVTPAYVPESSKLTAIANAAVSVKASLRPFTTFAVRYIFERDPLEAMLRNIEHLNGWLSSSAGTVAASTTIHNNEDYVVEEVIVN